jgi:chemotaxis protein histidine kinase CheA
LERGGGTVAQAPDAGSNCRHLVGGGTGLGLSLVHAIMGDLGDAIDVRTTVGRGTIFTMWLPTAGEAALASVEVTAELPHSDGQTVVIVEDEKPLI